MLLLNASGCLDALTAPAVAGQLDAFVTKTVTPLAREGNPPVRIAETDHGMLNAIGLQGIGARRFVDEKLPELRQAGATVIVNICGSTLDEYVEVAKVVSDAEGVAALELNISCPNIKEGGIQFGCSLHGTFDVVSAAPAPVFDPTVTAPFAVHSYEIRLKPPVGWMAIPPAVVSQVMRSARGKAGPTLTAASRTASMTVVGSERA